MPRWVRWLLGVVAALVVLVVAAVVLLPFLVDTPRIQGYIASTAAQTLGRPVKFSSFSLRVLPLPAVELHDFEVAEDPKFGTAPFLRLQTGRVRLRLGPLLSGRVELGDIVLKKPVITVIQAADGRLNIASLGSTSEPRGPARPGRAGGPAGAGGAVAAARVLVDGGLVTYVARGRGDTSSQYRLSDLDLTVTGSGAQIAFKGTSRLQPGGVSLALRDGIVSLAGGRALTEAPLHGTLGIDGRDLAPLTQVAAGPAPAIGGGVKGTLTLAGTVGAPTATGEVTLAPLTVSQTSPACPEPKQRTLTIPSVKLTAGWQDQHFTARPLTASLAGGTLTTRLTATLGRGVHVELADLAIKTLPLETVLVDYLCEGYAVTGPLDLTGGLSFDARDLLNTLSGPGRFHIGSGKVVGPKALALIGGVVRVGGAVSSLLATDLPPGVFESPLEFESITGTYTLAGGVATTRDLLYTSRAMKVGIVGTYGLATGSLNLDMIVDYQRGQLQAKVTGTTASPVIRVSPASALRNIDPEKAEKGLKDLLKRFGK